MKLRQSKAVILNHARLYVVLDAAVKDEDGLLAVLQEGIEAGIDILQIRAKDWSQEKIIAFSEKAKAVLQKRALFIVNDDPKIALTVGADGVHLGQEDMPASMARRILGDEAVIGVSCQSVGHALKAQNDGADYIGLGSVFKTFTKPGRQPMDMHILEEVLHSVTIPVFPIGGITVKNVSALVAHGAERVAVTRAVCETDNVIRDIKQFQQVLKTSAS